MNTRILATFLLFLHAFCLYGQEKPEVRPMLFKGTVVDKGLGDPLIHAMIEVEGKLSGKKAGTTDVSGKFALPYLYHVGDTLLIKVKYLGYKELSFKGPVKTPKDEYNLGTLRMEEDEKMLQEVSITARRRLIEEDAEKVTFKIDSTMITQGATAADVLRAVPSVSLDLDGNVAIKGNKGVKVLINGRRSATLANLGQVLESIPGAQIEKVEVIANPSASYDADGRFGVLNIILKKPLVEGLFGSVDAGVAAAANPNDRFHYNSFGYVSYYRNKLSVYGSYSMQNQDYRTFNELSRHNLYNDFSLHQVSMNRSKLFNYYGRFGVDYELTKKSVLGASLTALPNMYQVHGMTTVFRMQEGIFSESKRDIFTDKQSLSWFLNLDYLYKIKPGEDVNISFSYDISGQDRADNFTELSTLGSVARDNEQEQEKKAFDLQLDYKKPLNEGKNKLELGLKWREVTNTNDLISLLNRDENGYLYDASISNSYAFSQSILAAYGTYAGTLGEKLKLKYKLGLRAEAFDYAIVQGKKFGNSNRLLYPSLHLTRSLQKDLSLNFSYSRRINRPEANVLNPFVVIQDTLNISYGNPALRPELGDNFTMGFSRYLSRGSVSISGNYYRVNNLIQSVTNVIDNQAVTSNYNFNSSETVGMTVSGDYGYKGTNLSVSGSVNRVFYSVVPDQLDARGGFSYVGSAFLMHRLGEKTVIQGMFNYNRFNNPQGYDRALVLTALSVRRTLVKDRVNLTLKCMDPFNIIRSGKKISTPAFEALLTNKVNNQSFGFNLTYNFGKENTRAKRNRQNGISLPNE